MSRFAKTTLLTGIPFGVGMGLFCWFETTYADSSLLPICLGAFAGLGFGLGIATFQARQQLRLAEEAPLQTGETLLMQGLANCYLGWEPVGGWLFLTEKRLVFRSHGWNFREREFSIKLDEIVFENTYNAAWFFPTGIAIRTSNGTLKFVVERSKDWREEIKKAREQSTPT